MCPFLRAATLSHLCAITSVVLATQLIGASTPAHSQQEQAVECVKRSAAAKPPPHPAGPRRAAVRKGEGDEHGDMPAARPKPLCPEGEVPVVKEFKSNKPALMKGNPLLGPRSSLPTLPQDRGVSPGRFRSFEAVYGKRGKRGKGGGGPKCGPDPTPNPQCKGIYWYGACYYYGSAALKRKADGGGMTMSVNRPAYDDSSGPGHTLDEIAVQGGTACNDDIVELGWLVSTDQNGDADPHIFVYHWVQGNGTCYNGCGWQQWSNTYYPTQNIGALIGREVYIGYVFWRGNWWAWFDDQWLGYFPGSLWNNTYTKSALLQWFGEVATENGIPPKTQMGDGVLPPPPTAAHMFTLCDVDAQAWVCWYRDQQTLDSPTAPQYYNIDRVGFGDTRYGGPGQ